MRAVHQADVKQRPIRGRVLLLIVFALLLYIVVPQLGDFNESLAALQDASLALSAVGAVLTVLTFGIAAVTYQLLSPRRLSFWRTAAVQGAGAFANRILPAGLGGLTLNVQYLRKHHVGLPQAVAVAGLNNALGTIGHLLILGICLVLARQTIASQLQLPQFGWYAYAAVVVAGIVGLSVFAVAGLRHSLLRVLHAMAKQLASYRQHRLRLLLALGNSMLLTLAYVAIFYCCTQALGAPLGFLQAVVVFSAGMLVGTVTPTPGGLGGVEAGLVAGLVAYGIDPSLALAVTLFYRLLTYWLPLMPGFVLFMLTRKYY